MPAEVIAELIQLSRRFGADPAYVLAGGGNTSRKASQQLWVKASGHSLATIDADGFVALDRTALEDMLQSAWPSNARAREAMFLERVMSARVEPERGQRPSVEALLHHLIPHTFVVHTHPGLINVVACCKRGETLTREWWGDGVLWQPYVDPGVVLSQELKRNLDRAQARTGKHLKVIFLQNHGLIVAGDSAAEIEASSEAVMTRISQQLAAVSSPPWPTVRPDFLPTIAQALFAARPGLHIETDDSSAIRWLVGTADGLRTAMTGPLTPDQIVYCRSLPLMLEMDANDLPTIERIFSDAWQRYVSTHGWEPWVAIVPNAGIITMRGTAKLAQTTRAIYTDAAAVYRNAELLGGVTTLSAPQREFIEQWEVEAYRRSIAAK